MRVYALKSIILGLRLSVVCVHIFCFCFSKDKIHQRKQQLVQLEDLIPPPNIYIHVYFVHVSEYMYAEIWSIWIFRALQVSHPDPMGSQPSTLSVQCVCVCAYTNTYTQIHSHPLSK